MTRVICVVNQKGGVGKTTTAVNLAVGLARGGARALLVDLDPQCNATSGLGVPPAAGHPLVDQQPLRQFIVESVSNRPEPAPRLAANSDSQAVAATLYTRDSGLQENIPYTTATDHRKGAQSVAIPGAATLKYPDLLPGSPRIREVERCTDFAGAEFGRLRDRLAVASSGYEFAVYDCPPSAGGISRLALATATEVLIPIECEYYAMEGLTQLIGLVREVVQSQLRMSGRPTLESSAILLTKHDPSLDLTQEVEREIAEHFGEILLETIIPRDVALAESPSHGMSVLDYAPRSRGARSYVELCMEVLGRE